MRLFLILCLIPGLACADPLRYQVCGFVKGVFLCRDYRAPRETPAPSEALQPDLDLTDREAGIEPVQPNAPVFPAASSSPSTPVVPANPRGMAPFIPVGK